MRRLLSALVTASLALIAGGALARAAAVYNAALVGSQTASSESEGVALRLNASGDLHGMLQLTLRHEGGNVTGGSWTLTVLPPNADASSSEKGRLTGGVAGGAVTLDEHGIVTSAASVRLTVQGGAGVYAGVTAGGGTVSLSGDPENATKLGGPLVLDF
ncbi:MAG TPA: hypothetical protein VF591_21790 [Pyrinomonadaceae bacterium]|jgi:hypothetical protein